MTTWITERTDNTVTSGSTTVGSVSTGLLDADNIRIDGNTISSTDTNGNITLSPDGTGIVSMTSTGNAEIKITGAAGMDAQLSLYGDRDWYIQNDGDASLGTADFLHIRDASADPPASRLVIDTSGNVGIGTTSPEMLLHLNRSSQSDVLRIQTTNTTLSIGEDSDLDNFIRFRANVGTGFHFTGNNDTPNLTILAAGNIGIGTNDPKVECHVESTSPQLRLSDSDSTSVDDIGAYIEFYDRNNTARGAYVGFGSTGHAHFDIYNQTSAGEIRFFTNSIERVSIDASNNVTLGLDGTQQGKLVMHRKDADEFPYIKMHSSDGTASYLFVANNGTLRIHDSAPTADGDGSAV